MLHWQTDVALAAGALVAVLVTYAVKFINDRLDDAQERRLAEGGEPPDLPR